MGFKIILDWVPNHTGWDHQWITDHPDWYTQVGDVIIHPAGTDWTDVADLNYDNPDMRAEMIADMAFWVEEVDVDGFRCDVAGSVPTDFWNVASKELNAIKPLFMLAEDGSNFSLLEEAFDANYSWNLMNTMNESVYGNQSANSLKSDLIRLIALYPEGTYPMNFVTNHDENSWNGTAFERLGEGKNMMEALIFVAPGIPMIYSGQEASLDKRLLFFEKDEIDWSDLRHQDFLSNLVQLKKDNPALWNGAAGGDIKIIKTTDKHILTFIRTKGDNRVLYVGNLKGEPVSFKFKEFEGSGSFEHYLSQELVELTKGTEMTLEGFGFEIYTMD